jgi:hypothetical protein
MSAPTRSLAATTRMAGQVSSVVTPSSSRAMGRRARWSIRVSVSNEATSAVGDEVSRASMAAEAPMPASTHPSRATTRTGRDSLWSAARSQLGSNS